MDETIYVILKILFDLALEVWFSIYAVIVLWLFLAVGWHAVCDCGIS